MFFMHPSPLSGFSAAALRVPLAISLALLLSIASIRPASAQIYDPYGFPYGEIDLTESALICGDSLSVVGNAEGIYTVSYGLVLTTTDHIGVAADIYAGLRLRSQPGKLWLFTGNVTPKLVEYDPAAPTPYFYWRSPETLGYGASLSLFNSPRTPADLSHLVGDAEVLVGYGLRQGASSTTADSFKEMLDSQRFQVVWRVGEPSGLQTCFEYDKIQVIPDMSIDLAS